MTWTPNRPTKPGKYWLSVAIPDRERFACAVCREVQHVYTIEVVEEGCGLWLDGVIDVGYCLPESVKFLPYVEPPDPFAEPVEPKSRQTLSITTEERKTLSSALHTMAGSLRKLAKTNPSDAHGAIAEADRMDALNARICEVRGFTPDETRGAMDGGAFAEPVPSLREKVEGLPRYTSTPNSFVVRSQRGHYLDRSEVLALLDEVTR